MALFKGEKRTERPASFPRESRSSSTGHEASQHRGGAPAGAAPRSPRAGTNLSGPRSAGRVSGGRSARRGGSAAPRGLRSGPLGRPWPPAHRPGRYRPPPPRGIPGAGHRPRRLRGSQQTPLPVPANRRAPLPEEERRPRRLTGQEGGRADCKSRRASGPPPRPAEHPARAAEGWLCRPCVGLPPAPSGLKAAAVGVPAWKALTELLEMEETSSRLSRPSHLPRQGHYEQCCINASRWVWNSFREGDSPDLPGQPIPVLCPLSVEKFFAMLR